VSPPGGGDPADLEPAAEYLRRCLRGFTPRATLVLGSGLGSLARGIAESVRVSTDDIPGWPTTTVPGHRGELVAGRLEGVPVIVQNGRYHLYEGHRPAAVALPVRLCSALGARLFIVTNAAGGLNPRFRPPTLMLIADHINCMWRNPLTGPVLPGEQRWPDMSRAFDSDLRALARRVALERGITLKEGVYAAMLGPSYETAAEVHMLLRLGADAVGMSTVPEVIAARARGMRVLGLAAITNAAAGLTAATLSHEDVLAGAGRTADQLESLIRGVLRGLDIVA
jgi:purine-nucleoside phosphorylase